MSGYHCLTGRRQLPQESNSDPGRLVGIMLKAVVPLGVIKPRREDGVTGEKQYVLSEPRYAEQGTVLLRKAFETASERPARPALPCRCCAE